MPPHSDPRLPSPKTGDKPWAQDVSFPSRLIDRPLVRPDADTVVEISAIESRPIMERVAVTAAKWACGDIVVPSSVSGMSLSSLGSDWQRSGAVSVAKSSRGEFLIQSSQAEGASGGHFALLSPELIILTAGILTDRPLAADWPEAWSNYDDCVDKRVLDHCCGRGAKVRELRERGIDAHGVDICSWGSGTPSFLHYGRAERLPFVDGAFDRVESRMGALLWAQDDKQSCRGILAEMIRVTVDGGTIRIVPVRKALLLALVAERSDVSIQDPSHPDYGVFELVVRREGARS